MEKTKFNSIRLNTPKGYAQYPYLLKPDTKFNPEGDYKVTLAMEDNEASRKLINKLEQILDDFYESDSQVANAINRGKKLSKADIYEIDAEGRICLKFKQKAVITKKDGTKSSVKIAQFDTKGTPISVNIGRDSVLKISFDVRPYYALAMKSVGLSLRPVAVQVINLKEFGGNASASSYGFSTDEEGYEAAEDSEPPFEDEGLENNEDDIDPDF